VEGVWALPASRLLRAYHPRFTLLEKRRVKRIIEEMTYAAANNEVYHLWWHPHNFGWYPQQNLQALELILKHYQSLRQKYGMQSLTMAQTVDVLDAMQ
jgi:hypothetical protein